MLLIQQHRYRSWEKSGVMATVVTGESMLSIQQHVDDARFQRVAMTLMGGRVFLHCSNKDDILHVFNAAIDFFGMFFSNFQCGLSDHVVVVLRVDEKNWGPRPLQMLKCWADFPGYAQFNRE